VLSQSQWTQHGATVEYLGFPAAPAGSSELVRVEERGIDVEIEVLDRAGAIIARSDSPVERSALQYVYVPAAGGGATLMVRAKGPTGLEGMVRVVFLAADGATVQAKPIDCVAAERHWAEGDMAFARGHALTLGRVTSDAGTARAAFEAAERAYSTARLELRGQTYTSARGRLELNLAALAYYALKDWSGSASWGAQAAATFSASHDTYRQARAKAIEAAAWIELATKSGDPDKTGSTPRAASTQFGHARALLTHLAQLHATRHEWYDQALQINNIGLAYTYESRFDEAIPYFLNAQQAFQRLGDTTRSALALQNIGYCDWGMGRLSASIRLNNNGLAHYEAGQFDESLRLENMALDLALKLQSDQARARSNFGIAVTYYAIGDRDLAADFLHRSLDIATPELDARLRVDVLRALAQIELENGQFAEAIGHDREALSLASATWARAHILLHLAQEYLAQGDRTASRQILDELIAHPPNRSELVRALARVQRGQLFRAAGSLQLAQQDLLQALVTLHRYDVLADRFEARVELARVYADQGFNDQALVVLRRALKYSREIRALTANPEYRTSIVQSLRPALSLEVDLLRARFTALSKQGRIEAAKATARESLAAVDDNRAAGFEAWRSENLEQASDEKLVRLLATSTALYRDMAERRFELTVREDRAGPVDSRARALREDIARLRVRLGLVSAEIAKRSAVDPDSESKQRKESHRLVLKSGRAVIEYWLGTKNAYAWVLRGQNIDWIELPASGDIDHAARKLHEMMRSPASLTARKEACTELFRRVFAPLAPTLKGVEELTIVPDESLHYVPFSALRDPAGGEKPYLVQMFSLSLAPALRFLPGNSPVPISNRAEAVTSRMLLVADPVYAADDPRLDNTPKATAQATSLEANRLAANRPRREINLVRLESSSREASQIRALFGRDNVDLLQGVDATRESVLSRDLARYRFIHIATHGIVDSEVPQLSALVLGTHDGRGVVSDPYLRAADFLNATFHAQTIVFSSCDSALGKEYGSEGLVGLRYAALARGAHAVVASLWPVSDGIAVRLMTDMYRAIVVPDQTVDLRSESDGANVAYALTEAVRAELKRAPELDPALWAPFTVYVAGN
jgi:CHAT domain-containing protein